MDVDRTKTKKHNAKIRRALEEASGVIRLDGQQYLTLKGMLKLRDALNVRIERAMQRREEIKRKIAGQP